jgi:hypothetical protein
VGGSTEVTKNLPSSTAQPATASATSNGYSPST